MPERGEIIPRLAAPQLQAQHSTAHATQKTFNYGCVGWCVVKGNPGPWLRNTGQSQLGFACRVAEPGAGCRPKHAAAARFKLQTHKTVKASMIFLGNFVKLRQGSGKDGQGMATKRPL